MWQDDGRANCQEEGWGDFEGVSVVEGGYIYEGCCCVVEGGVSIIEVGYIYEGCCSVVEGGYIYEGCCSAVEGGVIKDSVAIVGSDGVATSEGDATSQRAATKPPPRKFYPYCSSEGE